MYRGIKIALLVIGLVSAVLWFFMPSIPDNPSPDLIEEIAETDTPMKLMFIIMWVMVIATAALALFFGFKKMLTSSGGLKKALFAIAGLAVLFIIGYFLSSGEEADAVVKTFEGKDIQPTAGTVKTIGMLLNVFFGMTVVAVLLMVLPGLKRIISK